MLEPPARAKDEDTIALLQWRRRRRIRFVLSIVALFFLLLNVAVIVAWYTMFWMPGRSFAGEPPALTPKETAFVEGLQNHVEAMARDYGERNVQRHPLRLEATAQYIALQLESSGYIPERQTFRTYNVPVENVIAELPGDSRTSEILVLGAHYDTVPGSPGANDNASGVAANLLLAQSLAGSRNARTIRFAFFTNEELPYWMTEGCGSLMYARRCKERSENIVGMISLETMGYYTSTPDSQEYPRPLSYFFPTTGNFVAFVGNIPSRDFLHETIRPFRQSATIGSEGIAATTMIADVTRSDHFAFWSQEYPALMVTDTANFRHRFYHTPEDTADKLNYTAFARVVAGLDSAVRDLLNPKP